MNEHVSPGGGLHVRYEKAGLILDALPIPQNADAVIVEAIVRLPAKSPCEKQDFILCGTTPDVRWSAELVLRDKARKSLRVFFRFQVPAKPLYLEFHWREHKLGEFAIPVISTNDWIDAAQIEFEAVHTCFKEEAVNCKAFVSGQAKQITASALLRCVGPLAPATDWNFRVHIVDDEGESLGTRQIPFTSDEMRRRQTLTTTLLPKLSKIGSYEVSWHLANRRLGAVRLRVLSKRTFAKSLRVSATRFVIDYADKSRQTVRSVPQRDGKSFLDGVIRIKPVFYVASTEAGVAGLAPFTLRALIRNVPTTLAIEKDVLVTDGIRAVGPAWLSPHEIADVKQFTLSSGDAILGNLPLEAAPSVDFTAEGGFAPLDDFLWSPAAEEQLNDRLGKLLDGE
jgi:hypothetical protein